MERSLSLLRFNVLFSRFPIYFILQALLEAMCVIIYRTGDSISLISHLYEHQVVVSLDLCMQLRNAPTRGRHSPFSWKTD